jgi:hypothetical protein
MAENKKRYNPRLAAAQYEVETANLHHLSTEQRNAAIEYLHQVEELCKEEN